MKRFIPAMAAAALLATSCGTHIRTKPLPHPNPTSYSFPDSVPELREAALKAFSLDHQMDDPIFGRQSRAFRAALHVETVTNTVFCEMVFRDATNAQDLVLHTMHDPIVLSAVYVGKKGPLPLIASFHLHLEAVSSGETRVTVKTIDPEVIAGQHFGFGPCGPGMANTYRPVQPSTVEEYTVLRYLGNYLGVTNMPAVIYPTGD